MLRINKKRNTETGLADFEKSVLSAYPDITLPPEFTYLLRENLMMFLIKLARYKFIMRLLRKSDTVLDVGCSRGYGSLFLSQHCKRVLGIDGDAAALKDARHLGQRENLEFKQENFFSLSASLKYDAVVAVDVIEHLDEKTGAQFIGKTCKHLKKNGLCIIGTPSIYASPYESEWNRKAHIKMYDQEELSLLLGKFYGRTLAFSMNDELVHTGFPKLAWYYFAIGMYPGNASLC